MIAKRLNNYEVIIIGGGPAGTAAATLLQDLGHRCLILKLAQQPHYHLGDALISFGCKTLARLGLAARLKSSSRLTKYNVHFQSFEGEPTDPFCYAETIEKAPARLGLLNRSLFDEICLENAQDHGVEIREDHRVEAVVFDGDQAIGVQVSHDGEALKFLQSKVVIDASGYSALIGSQLHLKTPDPNLRKAAVWSYYKGSRSPDEWCVFQEEESSWLWHIPLPDELVSVGWVTDAEALSERSQDPGQAFLDQVHRCRPLRQKMAGALQTEAFRFVPQLAYRNQAVVGAGWVMVGVAMAFLDPIYASRVCLALGSAEWAADSIHEALVADDFSRERLGQFGSRLKTGIEATRSLIHAFYDPRFSFHEFVRLHPEQRNALAACLIGDVVDRDLQGFRKALASMTPRPVPLMI